MVWRRDQHTVERAHDGNDDPHGKDEQWAAVDKYALHQLHSAESKVCIAIKTAVQLSKSSGLPSIQVSPMLGKFLTTQCQIANAKHVLEIGTLGGVSSIWMASSGPDVKVTTVEIKEKYKAVAEAAIAHASLSSMIKVVLGAGTDVLPTLRQEIKSGKRPMYDFTFIDADKENGLRYLNEVMQMSRSGAGIVVDNVVRKGQIAYDEAAKRDKQVAGARELVEAAGKDHRLSSTTLIQTVGEKGYDGFLLCVVK